MNDALASFFHAAALSWPLRLREDSAWNGHIPFAMNLVAVAKPRLIVELGTHAGASYCAMCQSVAEQRLSTSCFAVDTWTGEEHSGLYGPEVLQDLRDHHDGRYGTFSRLLQMTFDEALPLFSDGSVDLLHIDGCHTYEAARRDFDSWLPRMSSRGVVLLHDVLERDRGFGVWRLYEELERSYPCFQFTHSHGLGVVAVGSEVPAAVTALVSAQADAANVVRSVFEALGHRLELALERIVYARRCEHAEQRVATAERSALEAGQRAAGLEQRAVAAERNALETEQRAADARARAADERARHDQAMAAGERRRVDALAEVDRLRAVLDDIEQSKAWRAAQAWRALRDRAFPRGGRARDVVGAAVDTIRGVIDRSSSR